MKQLLIKFLVALVLVIFATLTMAPSFFTRRGGTVNVTLTGRTTIQTNLLINGSAGGTQVIGETNLLEALNQDGLLTLALGTNGYTYAGSNVVVQGGNLRLDGTGGTSAIDLFGNNGTLKLGNADGIYGSYGAYNNTGIALPLGAGIIFSDSTSSSYLAGLQASGYTTLKVSTVGTFNLYTNVIVSGTLTATNGVAISTNAYTADPTPISGLGRLVVSNYVLLFITPYKTNVVSNGEP